MSQLESKPGRVEESASYKKISSLQMAAENQAKVMLWIAIGLTNITFISFISIVGYATRYEPASELSLKWSIAKLSAGVVVSALLLLVTRVVWNCSNIWVGRSATLEDLLIALHIIGVDPESLNGLGEGDHDKSIQLLRVVVALSRLRRSFEDELIKVPSLEGLLRSK
jgi:hypothetical protein